MLATKLGAHVNYLTGRHEDALDRYRDAVRLFRAAQRPPECALELTNVAIVCIEIGAGDDAVSYAEEALALARASYRLRDDDNILLGAIEAQLIAVFPVEPAQLVVELHLGEKPLDQGRLIDPGQNAGQLVYQIHSLYPATARG